MHYKLLAFALPLRWIVLMLIAFLDVSREEACMKAYWNGEPLSAYCSRLCE